MVALPDDERARRLARAAGLDAHDETAFIRALEAALAGCARGRPSALMHLDVARACDIDSACGREGVHALRDLMHAVLYNQIGPTAPVCERDTCALTVLLADTLPRDAYTVAKRLRGAIDKGTFRWHGHPFRLGAHIGVLELGPTPADAGPWLERVREACVAARELGGSGIQMVPLNDHAWTDVEREREWHKHLTEVI